MSQALDHLANPEKKQPLFSPQKQKLPNLRRLLIGATFISLGVATVVIGATSLKHRLTHIVINDGVVNGRIVRLRAPMAGDVKAFYAKPGISVGAGQLLARIEHSPEQEQALLQLTGEVQANTAQLLAARQSFQVLQAQLKDVQAQDGSLRTTGAAIATQEVSQRQADLEAARARARAARVEYERYKILLAEGVVTAQRVDHLQSQLDVANAEVNQMEAALQAAQTSATAAVEGVVLRTTETSLLDQRNQLIKAIQAQETLIKTLEAKVATDQARLQQVQSRYSDRQELELKAPFAGIVYSTEREQGEQINQSESVLTMLDCNDLWVESLIHADQASRIDLQQPVKVQLVGYAEPLVGEIDLMQPVSSIQSLEERSRLTQVQALLPTVPPRLLGQALTRVTVRIPPPPVHEQSQQFCGLGQVARLTFKK